jgi:hypothetical protein
MTSAIAHVKGLKAKSNVLERKKNTKKAEGPYDATSPLLLAVVVPVAAVAE